MTPNDEKQNNEIVEVLLVKEIIEVTKEFLDQGHQPPKLLDNFSKE